MGSRRLGRKRLFSLEKQGESLTKTQLSTGAGIEAALVRATQIRDGALIITELMVDLGATGIESHGANKAIGIDDGTADATLFKWTESLFGQLLDVDMMCAEDLAGGGVNAILSAKATAVLAKGASNGNTDHCTIAAAVKGDNVSATNITSKSAANVHFYLHTDSATDAAYTGGKLIIRVTGYDVSVPDA